jgi:Uma2 family endonuclease
MRYRDEMAAAERYQLLTVDDFLVRWESREKAELMGGQVYAMAGGTARHSAVAVNAVIAFGPLARLRGCQLFNSDLALQIGEFTAYFPDVMAVCDSEGDGPRSRTKPCLIIEVVSPSTQMIDEREKLLSYRLIPSLHDYLIVHPDELWVAHHHRGADAQWSVTLHYRGDVCDTTCLGTVAVDDLFIDL